MTNDGKGRGVFASKPLKKGTLIIVEKAVAEAEHANMQDVHTYADKTSKLIRIADKVYEGELVKKCLELSELKGIDALRLSYLYDGTNKESLTIPPIEVFF